MSKPISIHPEKSALLVMDYQNVILNNYLASDQASDVLTQTAELLDATRKAGMHIIYVMVAFRPGHPEVSPRNKLFSIVKEHGLFVLGGGDTSIHAAVAPKGDEPVVIKHRIGAFSGTDLDVLLRARDIDTLVLAGVTTAGVVLSTVRQAFDRDYQVVVASNCCTDPDAEVHRLLLDKILGEHAEVITAQQVIAGLVPTKA